jgi:hypothetical protein
MIKALTSTEYCRLASRCGVKEESDSTRGGELQIRHDVVGVQYGTTLGTVGVTLGIVHDIIFVTLWYTLHLLFMIIYYQLNLYG